MCVRARAPARLCVCVFVCVRACVRGNGVWVCGCGCVGACACARVRECASKAAAAGARMSVMPRWLDAGGGCPVRRGRGLWVDMYAASIQRETSHQQGSSDGGHAARQRQRGLT